MSVLIVHDLRVALGGIPILKGISFDIEPGQTVALLGDNGSGKSTLIKAILGLVRHQQGTVRLLDCDLAQFTQWQAIGYVPQRASVSLHSTTVAEVVGSGVLANRRVGWLTRRDRRAVSAALDVVGLNHQARELYLHLSGGQQQRVLIARGIVNRPQFIVMDEPFAGVDLTTQRELSNTLAGFDATMLVVLHETEAMADHLDRYLVLRQGRLVHDGTTLDLPERGGHEVAPPERPPLMSGMEPRWNS
ncbi:MAG: metal ABC transporter ATP-binding protein [Propionibacteriaceae bacterium]|jgi:zinc transport system ATP-binding protein|nr:metal ABC transporter ATP-binding protein [Propionibacteriaceae bacterium]